MQFTSGSAACEAFELCFLQAVSDQHWLAIEHITGPSIKILKTAPSGIPWWHVSRDQAVVRHLKSYAAGKSYTILHCKLQQAISAQQSIRSTMPKPSTLWGANRLGHSTTPPTKRIKEKRRQQRNPCWHAIKQKIWQVWKPSHMFSITESYKFWKYAPSSKPTKREMIHILLIQLSDIGVCS